MSIDGQNIHINTNFFWLLNIIEGNGNIIVDVYIEMTSKVKSIYFALLLDSEFSAYF